MKQTKKMLSSLNAYKPMAMREVYNDVKSYLSKKDCKRIEIFDSDDKILAGIWLTKEDELVLNLTPKTGALSETEIELLKSPKFRLEVLAAFLDLKPQKDLSEDELNKLCTNKIAQGLGYENADEMTAAAIVNMYNKVKFEKKLEKREDTYPFRGIMAAVACMSFGVFCACIKAFFDSKKLESSAEYLDFLSQKTAEINATYGMNFTPETLLTALPETFDNSYNLVDGVAFVKEGLENFCTDYILTNGFGVQEGVNAMAQSGMFDEFMFGAACFVVPYIALLSAPVIDYQLSLGNGMVAKAYQKAKNKVIEIRRKSDYENLELRLNTKLTDGEIIVTPRFREVTFEK